MRMQEVVTGFLAWKGAIVTPHTAAMYSVHCREIADFLGHDTDAASVTANDARALTAHLTKRHRPQSVRLVQVVARMLFGYAVDVSAISDNPCRAVPLVKPPRKMPSAISQDDFERMLRQLPDEAPVWRAVVLFLADTGCRVGGLCSLELDALDLGRRRAAVFEKDQRARWVYMSRMTAQAVENWLDVRPACRHSRVYCTSRLTPLTPNHVHWTLGEIGKRAGVKGRVNPHSFRHAFARQFLANGGNLAALAQLLGHSPGSPITAQYYAVWDDRELADLHERYGPLG